LIRRSSWLQIAIDQVARVNLVAAGTLQKPHP